MVKSSQKGGQFERDFCVILSKWFSKSMCEKIRDDLFWRTSGSGSRATTRMKKNKLTCNSTGDVCALDVVAQDFLSLVMIELKRGYSKKKSSSGSVSLLNMVDGSNKNIKKPLIIQWIEKAKDEASKQSIEHPIIVFKRDRKVPCIILQYNTFHMLQNNFKVFCYPHHGHISMFGIYNHNFIVIRLDDFFSWVPAKAFFEKLTTLKNRPLWRKRGEDVF